MPQLDWDNAIQVDEEPQLDARDIQARAANPKIGAAPELDWGAAVVVPDEERTWGEAGSDTLKQMGAGVNNLFGSVSSLIDPTSDASQFFKRGSEYWNDSQSDQMKAMLAEREAKIAEAAKNGEWESFKESLSTALSEPAIASKIVFETLPSMLPVLGAGKAATLIAETAKVSAKAATWLSRGSMAGTNAALTAGDARGAHDADAGLLRCLQRGAQRCRHAAVAGKRQHQTTRAGSDAGGDQISRHAGMAVEDVHTRQ
jgi:hypothetical protein